MNCHYKCVDMFLHVNVCVCVCERLCVSIYAERQRSTYIVQRKFVRLELVIHSYERGFVWIS